MASGPDPGEVEDDGINAELEAERTAAEHWRRIAEHRSAQYTALRRRPVVRAVLALERYSEPGRAHAGVAKQWVREAGAQAAVSAGGLGARLRGSARLTATKARPLPAPDSTRSVAVVVAGPGGSPDLLAPTWAGRLTVLHAEGPDSAAGAVARAMDMHDPDLVALVLPTSAPLDANWLARLANPVRGTVVAATPTLVHPVRPLLRASEHDGLVRAAGLTIDVNADGVPVTRSIGAGTDPVTLGEMTEIDAAGAAAVVIDATAYSNAGGLVSMSDLDAAVVELSARLRVRGGHIATVPSAVVVDRRPVRSRRELYTPVDPTGRGWIGAIERSGPLLRRMVAPTSAAAGQRFAVTVAAPSSKVALRWGDWHLGAALADSLRRRGHEVRLQTADHADDPAGRVCDTHLVLRGLQPVRRTTGQRHVLWIISHPETIDDDELDVADLVLVASPMFASHLRTRTSTPVDVLLQATDHHRFRPMALDPAHRHDVTIVAKTRDILRPVVADALEVGLRPRIYGGGWRGLVSPELIVTEHIDNSRLPTVYASAGVVLNDHWRTMRTWGFVSNRLFDVLACGTPVISDPVSGIAELFDGAVSEYRDPEHLRDLVELALGDPIAARRQAARGRARVLASHTFDHRADELLVALDRYR